MLTQVYFSFFTYLPLYFYSSSKSEPNGQGNLGVSDTTTKIINIYFGARNLHGIEKVSENMSSYCKH